MILILVLLEVVRQSLYLTKLVKYIYNMIYINENVNEVIITITISSTQTNFS